MRIIILVLRLVASLALAVLAIPFAWGLVSGDYYMTVTGVSMKPTYEIGDVLVVQSPRGNELTQTGRPVIVSFTPGDREDQYVHRVHHLVEGGAVLKGDGNEISDPLPVAQDQVLGTPRVALQGNWALLFHLTESWIVRAGVGVVFLGALFLPSRRGSTREQANEPETVHAPAAELIGVSDAP
ncbi:Type I signal peptidase [Leucobacter sp. 7(1)]|uniref:S24/S26 family peptidase n=1 Tax=Leucobacter sp. 7(1) TaxID=1255613 RepID=UPI00097F37B8|nr:S24/S26 family peptidase [Leucobacter sp. 7(1)]SJN07958.1 Type I signal peptidase [Leucobacter sp. 7(1)]